MKLLNNMKVVIIVLMFVIVSDLLIISNNNLALCKDGNVERFSKLYVEWINKNYVKAQTLMGEVVRFDWLPDG